MNQSITGGRQAPGSIRNDPPSGTTATAATVVATTPKPASTSPATASVPTTEPVKALSPDSPPPSNAKTGSAVPALADTLVVAWDTERANPDEYLETLLPDVKLDLEEVAGSWEAFPAFLAQVQAMRGEDKKHVTLVLNVHGNNGTGLKMVDYRREAAEGEPEQGPPTHAVAGVATAAQINVWLKEAGFDPSDVTVISEGCNAGPAYWRTIDGLNANEVAAAKLNAQKLAAKEHVKLDKVTLYGDKVVKADLTYHWIGRKSGGNTAGTVFLQVATGMGTTGVSGQVAAATVSNKAAATVSDKVAATVSDKAAAPVVDLNKLGKPGHVAIAVTGAVNPWPDEHFNEMIDALRQSAPRMFAPAASAKPATPAP